MNITREGNKLPIVLHHGVIISRARKTFIYKLQGKNSVVTICDIQKFLLDTFQKSPLSDNNNISVAVNASRKEIVATS